MRDASAIMRACRQVALLASTTYRHSAPHRLAIFSQQGPNYHSFYESKARKRLRSALVSAGILSGTFSFLYLAESPRRKLKHAWMAAERTGRVVKTLVLCINDYQESLKEANLDATRYSSILNACHQRCANRTLAAMQKNGSIFIKLGQHLSSMNYLLPPEWTETFIPLQDNCPVSSYNSVQRMFQSDTGYSIDHHFATFDPIPIGAASLAQVHVATLKGTGQQVAVKLQHPSLDEWVPLDLALTKFTFSCIGSMFPQYDLQWLLDEMEQSLPQELNFVSEANLALRTRRHFQAIAGSPLVVPDVKWAKRRIIVMEYIHGHRLDDLAYLTENKIDRNEVSAALARIFNEMIFGNTPLHCDPHGGNIAIRKNRSGSKHDFDIILYDHGLYREIPRKLQLDYAELWLAVVDGDEHRMREYSRRVAGITDEQFPLFASAITGRDYLSRKASVISSRVQAEKEMLSNRLTEGLLESLVQLLGQVPRVMLLILKTNDLLRCLDESLHTSRGPVRNFLILGHYCSRTVFEEQLTSIRETRKLLTLSGLLELVRVLASYVRYEIKLTVYECYITLSSHRR